MKNFVFGLSKDESSSIKGLLIFLIILGHNAVFTNTIPVSFGYLYTFHVQAFFVLPFLYGSKKLQFAESFKKNFARLYWPFIVFFIALSTIWLFAQNFMADPNNLLGIRIKGCEKFLYFVNAIFTGNYFLIDYFSGFQYLWFLPVMFSMSVIRETVEGKKILKWIILAIGFFSYIIFFVFMYNKPYSSDANYYMMLFSPFAVLQGCGAYFLGQICMYTMSHRFFKITNAILSTLFVVASIVYIYIAYAGYFNNGFSWFFRFIMPILFVNFLFSIKGWIAKSNVLKHIGNYSFPIYIIHPIICTISFIICSKFSYVNMVSALIIQLVVIIVSYCASILCFKIPLLKKKLFPRTLEEIYK